MKKALILLLPLVIIAGCAALQVREVPPAGKAARPASSLPAVTEEGIDDSREALREAAPRQPSRAPIPGPSPPPSRVLNGGERAPEGPPANEQYVSLNFDNAEIGVVIQTIAELISLNYIIAPGVRGQVTIQSTSKIPVSSLFTVLEEILEVNSLTAVRSGDFYKIVPTNQARQKEIETIIEGRGEEPSGNPVITKVVPLGFIRPSEVVKVLNPLKSPAGLYLGHDPTRLLFLTDSARKIGEMMKIVSILDVDSFAQIQVELYPVRYADVESLSRELTQVVTQVFASTGRGRAVFKIIPVSQINALMIISGEPGLAANILSWVTKLDQPPTEATDRIFVYHLAHATAEEIAAVLVQIFSSDSDKAAVSTPAPTPVPAARSRARTPARPAATARTEVKGAASRSPVTIVADKATNSLIIQTTPWYYPVVEETIQRLDAMPKQVLIEVMIAEITLDDETEFGLQWAAQGKVSTNVDGKLHNFNTNVQNVFPPEGASGVTIPSRGFSYVLTEANYLSAVLSAYAKDSRLHILSAPHIMAMDNKEAMINIGQEVPIVTTQTTETAGSAGLTNTITNDVEYRDTGIILTVTPHINEGRFVTLDVRQEVSEAQSNTLGGSDSPIIRKRTAETTMVVRDNQTLVIGGLIDKTKDRTREGLPYLSKIPVLGYLFGVTSETESKTELVLLITPRVVATTDEGDSVTRTLQERVMTLKEGIDDFKGGYEYLQEKGQ